MFSAITITKNFMHLIFGTGELKYPQLFGLHKDEIGKSFEATETKRENARFGILDQENEVIKNDRYSKTRN